MPAGIPPSIRTSGAKPGKRWGGRKKGTLNKVREDIRQIATSLVNDPIYLKNLRSRLRYGECAPGVEITLYHYAYGAPPKTLILEGSRPPLMFLTVNEIGKYDPLADAKTIGPAPPAHVIQLPTAEAEVVRSVVMDPETFRLDSHPDSMEDATEVQIPDGESESGNGYHHPPYQ